MTPSPWRLGLAVVLLASAAPRVEGQTRLFLLFGGDRAGECLPTDCDTPRVLEIDVDGRRVLANTSVLHARDLAAGPRVTPDGRFLLWTGTESRYPHWPSYLSVFDTAARAQSLPFSLTREPERVRPILSEPAGPADVRAGRAPAGGLRGRAFRRPVLFDAL